MAFKQPTEEFMDGIRAAVSGGLTGTAINMVMHLMAGSGFGVAQATGIMRKVMPDFRMDMFPDTWTQIYYGYRQKEEMQKEQPDNDKIRRWTYETDLPRATAFRYRIKYTQYDLEGNPTGEVFRFYYSDRWMSPQEAVGAFLDAFSEAEPHAVYLTGDYELDGIEHNRGWE